MNAYVPAVGNRVAYYTPAAKVTSAKITAVTDSTHVVLAIVNSDGTRTALNSGTAVVRWTAHGQFNVWRPY